MIALPRYRKEIIDAEPSSIRLDKPYTMKIIGKGNKARVVPLMDEAIVHIRRYMDENHLLAPQLHSLIVKIYEVFQQTLITNIFKNNIKPVFIRNAIT